MTCAQLRFLCSPSGAEAIALARGRDPSDPLAVVTALRRRWSQVEAAAVVELLTLRRRAAGRFTRAEEMFFEREALEQASGECVARWRAARFAGRGIVADLCCGLGGDAIALAEHARVVAVDREMVRLQILRENARVYGVEPRILPVCGYVPDAAPEVACAFADPSRRVGHAHERRRTRSLATMSPPLDTLLALTERIPNLGIKLSPAVDLTELAASMGGREYELEFISEAGACREAVVWLGEFVTGARRASVLPGGATRVSSTEVRSPIADRRSPSGRRSSIDTLPTLPGRSAIGDRRSGAQRPVIGSYLYEPDPAVIRAGMVEELAEELDAWTLDPHIAYLTSDRLFATPFAASYRIRDAMPFQLRRLRAALSSRGYADVVVKKRGFPMEPEELRRQLLPSLRGGTAGEAVVLLARVGSGHMAIVAERARPLRDEG